MRLVACASCHTQYDVSEVSAASFACRCGATVRNQVQAPTDARVQRCAACGGTLELDATTCGWCRATVVRDPAHLGLVCPECFARVPERARFCTGCGVEFRPHPVGDPGKALPCPVCEAPTAAHSLAEIWVHECARCHGLWVPAEDFDALVRRIVEQRETPASFGLSPRGTRASPPRSTLTVTGGYRYRRCPVCTAPMHRKNFGRRSGVIVDWCAKHGIWFDADELEHVAEFVRAGGLEEAGGHVGDGLAGTRLPAEAEAALAAARARAAGASRPDWGSGWLDAADVAGTLLDLFRRLLR